MKFPNLKSIPKMIIIVLWIAIIDTFFAYFIKKLSKLEIPLSSKQNKPQTFKSVLIDKNSEFYGIFNDCCNKKNLIHFIGIFYQCKICMRVFERTK